MAFLFASFDREQLRMLIVTARKRALELVNLLSMKVIHLKLAKLYLRRAANFYRGLYGGGTNLLHTIQTSVKISHFAKIYLR